MCVGLVVGYWVGRGARKSDGNAAPPGQRESTLKMLLQVLEEMERITGDVRERNTEIEKTARHVDDLEVTPEMQEIKHALLGHVAKLLNSNQSLEDDLLYAQYRMQEQADEIDTARQEARTDALTGVSNRKAFDEKLHLNLGKWLREDVPFVLILIDLDHFKRINDSHGHQSGDRVLEVVGDSMKQLVRQGDFVARIGGDEFGILLPHTEIDIGRQVAERIREKVALETSEVQHNGEQVAVALSIGVAAVRPDDTTQTLFARADDALYHSKRHGRNQVNCESGHNIESEEHDVAAAT